MLKKILFRELSTLEIVFIILGVFLLYALFKPTSLTFFLSLLALLTASAIMLLYLLLKWAGLSKNGKSTIIVSILVWLTMLYALIHANGLSISSLFFY